MHKNIIQKESMENELLNSSKALFKQSNRINHLLSLDTEHETSARLIDKYYRIFSKSLDRHVESKLRSQLSILLANFVELVRAGEDGFIRTPTGSKNLPQTRYFNGLTRNVYVKNILHNPAASGLIEMHKGFCSKNGNKETQIRPINQLKMDVLDILSSAKISRGTKESVVVREVIKGKYNPISREHEKRYIYIDYKDSKETIRYRQEMDLINKSIDTAKIGLWVTDKQIQDIKAELNNKNSKRKKDLNLHQKRLTRIFNSNDFSLGGRLYSGFYQSIPSDYRQYITIDHQFCVELDYSRLHPSILYIKNGLSPLNDAYAIDDFTLNPEEKSAIKVIFQIMINSNARSGALSKIKTEYKSLFGTKLDKVIESLEKKHHGIKKYLYTQSGRWLQKIDSSIAVQVTTNMIKKHNTIVLPIHDSFIVQNDYLYYLKVEMNNAFKEYFNIEIDILEKVATKRLPHPLCIGDNDLHLYQSYFSLIGIKENHLKERPYLFPLNTYNEFACEL